MTIETLEIAGFRSAFEALRLPYGKECRSKTSATFGKYENSISYSSNIEINDNDMNLAKHLVKSSDVEAKVIRGINVFASITAPIYFFRELETYRAGHERLCAESTMHIDCRGLEGYELQKAKGDIKMGKMTTAIDMFSYQCLRNIYLWRQNHRLPEWGYFCKWIDSLPFAEELITIGIKKQLI